MREGGILNNLKGCKKNSWHIFKFCKSYRINEEYAENASTGYVVLSQLCFPKPSTLLFFQ